MKCAALLLKNMWADRNAKIEHPLCPVCGGINKKRRGKNLKHCSQKCRAIAYAKTDHAKKFAASWATSQKIGAATLRGAHGFGRTKMDNPNHAAAKWYRIRSPDGIVHEVKNMRSFCRKNVHLFESDDRKYINATRPLCERAADGLVSVSTGKACSWFGWTAVCVFDIETDPLARRVALPSNSDCNSND